MTRKEAINNIHLFIINYNIDEYANVSILIDLINKIYDDLKNQKCKNCKDFKDGECRIFAGAYAKDVRGLVTKENFYCKYFEGARDEYN